MLSDKFSVRNVLKGSQGLTTATRSVMSVTRCLDRPQMSNNENDQRVCVLSQIFDHFE